MTDQITDEEIAPYPEQSIRVSSETVYTHIIGALQAENLTLIARLRSAEAKLAKAREALGNLVDAVGHMKAPQTTADAAMLISVTLGPVYETAARIYKET